MFAEYGWPDVHFVPVPVVGARHRFEMCAQGLVRKTEDFLRDGESRWLSPHPCAADDPTPVYRLDIHSEEVAITVEEVFASYGKTIVPAGWLDAAKREVRRLNQVEWEQWRSAEQMRGNGEEDVCGALGEYVMRECPWAAAHVRGDCRGADPVLGF